MEEKDREGNVKGEKEEQKERGRERGYGKQKAENITQTAVVVWRKHRWDGNGQITFFDLSPIVLLHRTILFLHNGPFLIFAGI